MEITHTKENNVTVLSAAGRLDAVSSPGFEKELTALISAGETLLIVDFGRLDYISSAGLRTILAAAKKLREKQGKLFLAGLRSVVKEVFEISGFTSIIPIFESVEAARANIA